MPTITDRRRRALRPALPVEELFEQLEESDPADREELLFERAAYELDTGRNRRGMYAMALMATDGDKARAGARYLQLRVDQLVAEYATWEEERQEELDQEERLAEASADFFRTAAAVICLVLAIIAILSWS